MECLHLIAICAGTEGVAEELIRMALPVIRADFKALETYRPQPWPEGLLFEDMPQEVTPEQRTRTPITVFGGYKDHFVCADACFDWFQFVLNGPVCLEAVIPIFRPETAVTAAENIVSALPAFRLFMDKEGTHFSVFDKESGSGAWAFGIITDTCQHYGSKRLTN